jgi:NADPH:quinone reductase-like Zn-dependent oxidoreductase
MSTLTNDTMRATIWNGIPYEVSIKTIPKSRLRASEDAVVRLTSAAICGSDLHIYHGILGSAHPGWVLGHEGVGIVQSVGEAVQNVKPGDRVIVSGLADDGVLKLQDVPSITGFGLGSDFGYDEGMQGKSPFSLSVWKFDLTLVFSGVYSRPSS